MSVLGAKCWKSIKIIMAKKARKLRADPLEEKEWKKKDYNKF